MPQPDPSLSATLEQIKALIVRRDQLLARMNTSEYDAGLREAEDRFTGAQDRLAAWVASLVAAVEAGLGLHQPVSRGRVMNCCEGCEAVNFEWHEDCCHEWPCPTYEAVRAALTGQEERSE